MFPKPISEVNKIGFVNLQNRFCRTGRHWQDSKTFEMAGFGRSPALCVSARKPALWRST
jgi:hypothetical protein